MTKPTNWPMCPAKTRISLGIRPVWSESSLCAQWVAKGPSFHRADSEDWSHWADKPFCWFCHEAAQICLTVFATCIAPIRLTFYVSDKALEGYIQTAIEVILCNISSAHETAVNLRSRSCTCLRNFMIKVSVIRRTSTGIILGIRHIKSDMQSAKRWLDCWHLTNKFLKKSSTFETQLCPDREYDPGILKLSDSPW